MTVRRSASLPKWAFDCKGPVESLLTIAIAVVIIAVSVIPYYRRQRRKETEAKTRRSELKMTGLDVAGGMHPRIDALACIGCGNCVMACPEENVLGVVNGTAVLLHGAKCVGHGRCADACPVDGINMVFAPPGRNAELPLLNERMETTLPGVFVAGELGGIGLIRNAVTQGTSVVRAIASDHARAARGSMMLSLSVRARPDWRRPWRRMRQVSGTSRSSRRRSAGRSCTTRAARSC